MYVYKFLTKMIPRCKFWSGQVLDEARFQSGGIPLTKPMFDRHKADAGSTATVEQRVPSLSDDGPPLSSDTRI